MPQEKNRPTFAPLDLFRGEENLLSAQAQRRWLLALMIVGLALRLTRYLLRFPLWEDEAMLSANLLDRGYAGLLQPLHYCQVAPTLFLWGQLTLVKLLGFNEYTLRLIPFLCGLASLLLVPPRGRAIAPRHCAGAGRRAVRRRLPDDPLRGRGQALWLRSAVALALLALAVEWLRRPDQTRWLWCLAALVGPAVGYSFPAIFMAGGVSLVIAWVMAMDRRRAACALADGTTRDVHRTRPLSRKETGVSGCSGWVPWIVYNVLLVASFAAVLVVSKGAVGATNQQTMEETHWADTFPPLTQPLKLPLWLLEAHAGAMLGYPVGGPNWGSTFSLLCVVVGVAVLVRRRQGLLLGLLLAPLGLNFIAAAMHRFPYGGHARMTLFLAPAFCLLIAFGLTAALAWIEGRRRRAQPALDGASSLS